MAKELPFFKFDVTEWSLGRIQKRSPQAQAVFINLCCKYWHKLGEVTIKSAELDYGKNEIAELIEYEIIRIKGDNIAINFLDEQLEERSQHSKSQSVRGKLSAEKRKSTKDNDTPTPVEPIATTVQPNSTTVQPNPTEENRIEEKREEEKRVTPNHLDRFFASEHDRMKVIKYMESIGIKYHDVRFRLYIESYDASFAMTHENGDYNKWKQYLKYFFENKEYKKVKIPYEHQEKLLYR